MKFQASFRPRFGCALSAGLAALALGAAPSAHAGSIWGSAGIITSRPCTAAATADCNLAVKRSLKFFDGGMSSGISGSFGSAATHAAVEASFDGGYLPVLRAGSNAVGATRDGATVVAFRSYTYTGAVAIDFALSGALHYVNSGDVSLKDGFGEGALNVILSIFSFDALAGLNPASTASDIFASPFGDPDCATGAAGVSGYSSLGKGSGEHLATVSLTTGCGGSALTLHPGNRFVIGAVMQAISNRGGFIDAMHTFRVQLDPEHTYFAGTHDVVDPSVLGASISASVPEPASWTLLILGFGAVGGMVRARRRVALV